MLTISFEGGDPQAIVALAQKGPQIVESIVQKLNSLMIRLQAHVVQDKLSGQVLRHRTGKLASSVRAILAQQDGESVVASVQGAGGPAWYGRVQEFGAHIPERVPVKARALHWMSAEGTDIFRKRARAFDLPARSFMQSSLVDYKGIIVSELQAEVAKVLAE